MYKSTLNIYRTVIYLVLVSSVFTLPLSLYIDIMYDVTWCENAGVGGPTHLFPNEEGRVGVVSAKFQDHLNTDVLSCLYTLSCYYTSGCLDVCVNEKLNM